MPLVSFKTVGCRLNQAETATMAQGLEQAGYRRVRFGDPAHVSIVHSCAITANAVRTCIQYARAAKKRNPRTVVVVVGCAVRAEADRLRREGAVDLLLGQEEKFGLAERLRRLGVEGDRTYEEPGLDAVPSAPDPAAQRTHALVKIQDGCSFRCAYCIVPHTRGEARARPWERIVAEIEQKVGERGYREIVLTGANLGTARWGRHTLIDLLRRMETVEGLERIRLSSIECSTIEHDLIDYMQTSPRICRYLHLPLQSGDNGILKAMRRRYTAEDYRALVRHAAALDRSGLGTDVMVGFPGEDDAAFQNTYRLVESLPFSNLHVFQYSPRPHTPAASFDRQVPAAVKKERAGRLIALGQTKQRAFARQLIQQPAALSVLVETTDGVNASGRCAEYMPVTIRNASLHPGDIVPCHPTEMTESRAGVTLSAKAVNRAGTAKGR